MSKFTKPLGRGSGARRGPRAPRRDASADAVIHPLLQIEWVGGWLSPDVMRWPGVTVILVDPFYVSFFGEAASAAMRWL